MRQLPRRLQQQQAALGCGWKNAAATRLSEQILVILLGLEAEQGKLEAILTAGLAMTPAAAAAMLGKKRDNRVGKAHRLFAGNRPHLERNNSYLACLGARGDNPGAVSQWLHQAVGDSHQAGRLGNQGGFAGLVGKRAISECLCDEQLLSGISTVKCNAIQVLASPTRPRYCEFGVHRLGSE